jgi:hypothetical protein
MTLAAALILLLSGQMSLALNIAVFALVILYLLHSVALLVLPRLNPALFAQVTVNVPLWLQRTMAVISILFMIALLTQLSLPAIKLLAGWAAVGAILFLLGRRRR